MKPLFRNFIVFGNGILGNLTKNFWRKSTAITICWYPCYWHITELKLSALQTNSSPIIVICPWRDVARQVPEPRLLVGTRKNALSFKGVGRTTGFVPLPTDKQLEVEGGGSMGKAARKECIRARSRSMVNGVRKLTRLHSFSGSVPRWAHDVWSSLVRSFVYSFRYRPPGPGSSKPD